MAIVTLKYLTNRNHLKAHLRYITHRRGQSREKITRPLFTKDGLTDKKAVYGLVDKAPRGTLFYKIMVSPDPIREDTHKDLDLTQITRATISRLEKRTGRRLMFVAALHSDHTDKRHVHGIFFLKGRLNRRRFQALAKTAREGATTDARLQRKARDRILSNPRYLRLRPSFLDKRVRFPLSSTQGQFEEGRRAPLLHRPRQPIREKVVALRSGCPTCHYGEVSGIPAYKAYCPLCRNRLDKPRFRKMKLEVSG